MTLDQLITYFPGAVREGDSYKARCPVPTHGGPNKAHPGDHNPSLTIGMFKGRPSVKCWVGCTPDAILTSVGLTSGMVHGNPSRSTRPKVREVDVYDYVDADGVVRDHKVRTEPKGFYWRDPRTKQPGRSTYRGLYGIKELIDAPADRPVFLVEGEKSVNLLRTLGAVAVCAPDGAGADDPGLKWRPHYTDAFAQRHVLVLPDKDAAGQALMQYVVSQIRRVAASVKVVDYFLGPAWSSLDNADVYDYLTDDKEPHTLEDLLRWCERFDEVTLAPPLTISEVHQIFRKWFGPSYDVTAIDAVLATIAVERMSGDPVWLLIVSGPGATKTELVMATRGAGAIVTSDISSPGGLLSGTSNKDKAKNATGGLLMQIGERGVLGIKDLTTLLSMHHEARAMIMAVLREVYDGYYQRNVGADGGRQVSWVGRIGLIGGVTSKWDAHHEAIAAMGDRFVLVRLDSSIHRDEACDQSLANTGHEGEMRSELADAVGRLLTTINPTLIEQITDDERARLRQAANLVTQARTTVEFDYQRNVEMAHMPEMPTRLAKQLLQIFRGACAIGITRPEAMNLAIRCAADSMPPMRLRVLLAVQSLQQQDQGVSIAGIADHLDEPWSSVKRQCESLHALGLLTKDVEVTEEIVDGERKEKRVWRYVLALGVDPMCLAVRSGPKSSPEKSEYTVLSGLEERSGVRKVSMSPDFSGDAQPALPLNTPF